MCVFGYFSDAPVLTFDQTDPVDGDALNAICTSSATVALTYTFKKDGVALTGGNSLSVSTFALPSRDIGTDDGAYTCEVTDGVQTFSSAAETLACK